MKYIGWKLIERVFAWPLVLIAAGLILNTIVRLANGGMPVPSLLRRYADWPKWAPLTPRTKLPVLGDILPGYFSIGDVLMIAGLVLATVNLVRSQRLKEMRRFYE